MSEITVVGVVVALPREVRGIRRVVSLRSSPGRPPVWRGRVGNRDLVLVCGGMGGTSATQATERLWHIGTPRLVIVAGLGGALSPELRSGDVVIDTEERWIAERAMAAAMKAGLTGRLGRIVTVAQPLTVPAAKHALGRSTGALVVDMEQAPAKALCRTRGTPFLGVRVVADTMDDDLSPLLGDGDNLHLSFFLRRLTHPTAIRVAWKLVRTSRMGAMTVGHFLSAFLPLI